MSDTKATISFTDGTPSVDFPIYKGSIGPDVIDIRKLYGQTGKFTFDPGFMSTEFKHIIKRRRRKQQ